ncbi:MAG TPA: outer membrane lipoprotein carrier protein LolA, partial [Coxiellaceae bacterium]|nr:outer membrane lipoprotein carrier protein LolA [Coxiellaceae bacterium]
MRKILMTCLLMIISLVSYADNQAVDALMQQLSAFHSITANFKQTVMGSDKTVLQQVSGQMAIVKPGQFRWEVKQPTQQLIVTQADQVWIYDPDLEQVIIQSMKKSVGQTPMLLLTNPEAYLTKQFTVQKVDLKNALDTFELIPNQDEAFSKLILSFKQGVITQMILFNQLDQTTQVDFSDVKMNTDID